MKDEDFDQLKEYYEKELVIDDSSKLNIQTKLNKIPGLIQETSNLLDTEKNKLINFEIMLKETFSTLYHKYKFPKRGDGLEFEYSLDSKGEITTYIEGNKDYLNKYRVVENQRRQVEFLAQQLINIKDFHWSLKNKLEVDKFYIGGI